MNRKLTLTACILWLAGLAAFIVGLNIPGDAGKWLTVIGQIVFLIGLALQGVLYFRQKRAEETQTQLKKPEDPKSSDQN